MRKILMSLMIVAPTFASAAEPACPSIENADSRPTFEATRLKEGRFTHRLTVSGKPLGDMVIEIRRDGDRYRITMKAATQHWESTLSPTFAPESAKLFIDRKAGPYEMSLRYAGGEVTGEERNGASTRAVKAPVAGIVVDQRVDWAAIMATTAKADETIVLQVYDPGTALSRMVGTIGRTERMTVPWGDADVTRLDYSICKQGGVEQYTVYASKAAPHFMIREDMPHGLTSELIRIEP